MEFLTTRSPYPAIDTQVTMPCTSHPTLCTPHCPRHSAEFLSQCSSHRMPPTSIPTLSTAHHPGLHTSSLTTQWLNAPRVHSAQAPVHILACFVFNTMCSSHPAHPTPQGPHSLPRTIRLLQSSIHKTRSFLRKVFVTTPHSQHRKFFIQITPHLAPNSTYCSVHAAQCCD